jgi:hypothetical protein
MCGCLHISKYPQQDAQDADIQTKIDVLEELNQTLRQHDQRRYHSTIIRSIYGYNSEIAGKLREDSSKRDIIIIYRMTLVWRSVVIFMNNLLVYKVISICYCSVECSLKGRRHHG